MVLTLAVTQTRHQCAQCIDSHIQLRRSQAFFQNDLIKEILGIDAQGFLYFVTHRLVVRGVSTEKHRSASVHEGFSLEGDDGINPSRQWEG
ncbi:hypothetical protein D3C80_1754160 [compost metagenome]